MTYLIDTNVLSEARRKAPIALNWLASVDRMSTFVSVISLGEIVKGAEIQRTKNEDFAARLLSWLDQLQDEYGDRILPINRHIAIAWGRIAAGRTRGIPDALLAATAQHHDLVLVTRNISDFQDLPIKLFNPWEI